MEMDRGELIDVWEKIVKDKFNAESIEGKKCVLFSHGTLLVVDAEGDVDARAKKQMDANGHVHAGSAFGDFNVICCSPGKEWIVTGHDPSMYTYVDKKEVESAHDLAIGLFGRSKRGMDAQDCQIIHIF